MINIVINGQVDKILEPETFEYNGQKYNYKPFLLIDERDKYQIPLLIKFNTNKYNCNLNIGDEITARCNAKSSCKTTKDGREFWTTTIICYDCHVKNTQPVQQQPQTQPTDDDLPF